MDIPCDIEWDEEDHGDVGQFCRGEKVYCDQMQRRLKRGMGSMRTPSGFEWLSSKYANPLLEELASNPDISQKIELNRLTEVDILAAPYLDRELGDYIDEEWWEIANQDPESLILSHDDYVEFSTKIHVVLFPSAEKEATLRRRIERDWKVDVELR